MFHKNKVLIFVLTAVLLEAQCSTVKLTVDKTEELEEERLKRDTLFSTPIYYDQMPAQAAGQPQPIPPALAQPLQQQQQQQPQQQQSQQTLPLVGALISNVPGLNGISSTLTTLVPLGNLGALGNLGGLGNLGSLGNLGGLGNLGALGNLGGLGNLGSLGGLGGQGGLTNLGGGLSSLTGSLGNLGGLLPTSNNAIQCPLTQTLKCQCENLLPTPGFKPTQKANNDGLEILQQNIKINQNGDKEVSARLSNGILLYQRTGNNQNSEVVQGYYTLQIKDDKYLNIYYTINDLDYTVKADVTVEPPQNDLVKNAATIPMLDF